MSGSTRDLKFRLLGEDVSASGAVQGFEKNSSKVTGLIGEGFHKLGGTIGGELGEVFNKVGDGIDKVGNSGMSMRAKLGIGAAALVGIGGALSSMGSKSEAAQNQLKRSIENSGHDWEAYESRIEEVVNKMADFGHTEEDTEGALQSLTDATRNPNTAIKDMSVVADLAAAKHISLAAAARLVGNVYNGNTKVLKQYGINMDSSKAAAANLTNVEKQHKTAQDELAKAQQHLNDVEAEQLDKGKLSITQVIALRNAHQALKDAENGAADAAKHLSDLESADAGKKLSASQVHALEEAHKKLQDAQAKVAKETQHLSDIEAIDGAKSKKSVSDKIALRDANDAVKTAQGKVSDSSDKLTAAQNRNQKATHGATDAVKQLGDKVAGQASAQADTFGGKIDAVKTKIENWASGISAKVGPAFMWLGSVVGVYVTLMDAGLLPAIGRGIVAMSAWGFNLLRNAAIATVSFGEMIAEGAVWAAGMAVDAAIAMAPFLPIIAVVAAVGVAAYELYAHWKTVWGWIKGIALDVWHWMVDVFHRIADVVMGLAAPVVWIVDHWRQGWDAIKAFGVAAWHWIDAYIFHPIAAGFHVVGSVFNAVSTWVGNSIHNVVNWLGAIPRAIANLAGNIWNGFIGAAKAAFNWVARAWNDTVGELRFTIPSWVPGIGGDTFGVPRMPTLMATGGVVTKPTNIIAGEAGPEAIVPLSQAGGYGITPAGTQGGGYTVNITLNVNGVVGDGRAVARQVLGDLQRLKGEGVRLHLA